MIEDDKNSTLTMLNKAGDPCLEVWEQCGHMVIRLRSGIGSVELAFTEGETQVLYDFVRKFSKRHWNSKGRKRDHATI